MAPIFFRGPYFSRFRSLRSVWLRRLRSASLLGFTAMLASGCLAAVPLPGLAVRHKAGSLAELRSARSPWLHFPTVAASHRIVTVLMAQRTAGVFTCIISPRKTRCCLVYLATRYKLIVACDTDLTPRSSALLNSLLCRRREIAPHLRESTFSFSQDRL